MVFARWSNNALGHLEGLDPIIRKRILVKVSWLENNFEDIVPEKLHRDLKGLYKLRVGGYRIVYSVRESGITVETVGHRRDVYK